MAQWLDQPGQEKNPLSVPVTLLTGATAASIVEYTMALVVI